MNPDWCSKLWCCLLAVSLATKRERGEPNFWTPPGQTVFSWELNSHFLLFGIKIFWEWHLKKKISLIFSWKQLLKVMWYITEPGSKSLLIHNSTFLVIRKCIFCFLLAKMTQWNSDERERSNICGNIRFQWIFMGCWDYFFLAIILCFWERKRKNAFEEKNFDGIKQFVKILMTPPPF